MSQEELSTHALSKALGLDRRLVARDIKAGMPRSLEGARIWRALHRRPYLRASQMTMSKADCEWWAKVYEEMLRGDKGSESGKIPRN
jgi:hypothetical protein